MQIAAKYSQEETKSKYVVQFGLAPFVKYELIADAQKTPYFFKYDGTTNSQVKKHCDEYINFFSKKLRKIVTLYCGTLFDGHCTADDLVDHFFEFVRDLGLYFNLLLALGIDGPNVNKSFHHCIQMYFGTVWMVWVPQKMHPKSSCNLFSTYISHKN